MKSLFLNNRLIFKDGAPETQSQDIEDQKLEQQVATYSQRLTIYKQAEDYAKNLRLNKKDGLAGKIEEHVRDGREMDKVANGPATTGEPQRKDALDKAKFAAKELLKLMEEDKKSEAMPYLKYTARINEVRMNLEAIASGEALKDLNMDETTRGIYMFEAQQALSKLGQNLDQSIYNVLPIERKQQYMAGFDAIMSRYSKEVRDSLALRSPKKMPEWLAKYQKEQNKSKEAADKIAREKEREHAEHAVGRVMDRVFGISVSGDKSLNIHNPTGIELAINRELEKISNPAFFSAPIRTIWDINYHGVGVMITKNAEHGPGAYSAKFVDVDPAKFEEEQKEYREAVLKENNFAKDLEYPNSKAITRGINNIRGALIARGKKAEQEFLANN